jgi:hypothetical protein
MSRKPDPKKTKKQNWMWIERMFYEIDDLKKEVLEIKKRLDDLEKKPSCCKSVGVVTDKPTGTVTEYGIDNHLKTHFDAVMKSIKSQKKK